MINALKALFEAPPRESEEQLQARLHLAAAALLIETSRADFKQDMAEQQAVEKLLSEALGLPPGQVHELMVNATNRVDEATSLYEFTRVINDYYSAEQKLNLVRAMWTVAYADGNLDKYEEALIRQVAELTYVPHQDYIRCKLQASGSA
jgi:uncharacterized tellurite resistance protein B-like protein